VKVCDTPPPFCASCYGQYTDLRHVDLEASYDGPVVEGGIIGEDMQVQDKIKVSIDELVLCETCLSEAAALIGLTSDAGTRMAELAQRNQEQAERLLGLQAYVDQLEKAITSKPAPAKKSKAKA
jgi:hypothetical protein